MFTFVFVALALFASTSQAMPTLQSRQAGGCANLGPASLFNASEFTLSAWYTTQSNDNSTGVPLAFRYIPSAGVNGETFGVISTVASTDPDVLALYDTQTWNLTNGALLPNGPLPGHVVDLPVTAGKLPVWALGTSLPPPADIYCALVSTSAAGGGNGFPLLIVNGDSSNSWSLCPDHNGNVDLVYGPNVNTATGAVYDLHQCRSVDVQIIGLD